MLKFCASILALCAVLSLSACNSWHTMGSADPRIEPATQAIG